MPGTQACLWGVRGNKQNRESVHMEKTKQKDGEEGRKCQEVGPVAGLGR